MALFSSSPTRRSLLIGAAPAAFALTCGLSPRARADNAPLIVVTSFPEELTTRYEREFERRYPEAHVQFVWKHSRDALALLSGPDQGGVDVYWAPSPNFPLLRDQGALRPIAVDRAVLPGRIGNQPLSDPSGTYEAYDLAGYGFALNPSLLRERGLPEPKSWGDLASPIFVDQIVAPIPSKVGFAPALYDVILQAEGWGRGWAIVSELVANARLVAHGRGPTASVEESEAPIGLTIDFLALSARANGAPIAFAYPARTAFLPSNIAVTSSTRKFDTAKAFVDFVLSCDGQKILLEADSVRHPARPDAYRRTGSEALINPFDLRSENIFDYDFDLGRHRPGIVRALFDIAFATRHAEVTSLWRSIHDAETRLGNATGREAERIAEARRLAGSVPVSTRQADRAEYLAQFAGRDAPDAEILERWNAELAASRATAMALLHAPMPG
ncbi:hypothetical+protein [Methylocapsa aurea]|uniref:ABC transporter substrate-binding protein n=1 Tax=Methylocapsa aurea TaxID=663610 RepID=UPI003D18EBD5